MAAPVLDKKILKSRKSVVVYPESDGKPMAETDEHLDVMLYLIAALRVHFAARPEVYVAGNNFIYYEEGNPKARVSPDVYVVLGARQRQRRTYRVWEEEGGVPDVIFEITSRKTRREDTDIKLPLYEREWGVPEYFLFDPTGDYLRPRLQGYSLIGGRYTALALADGRLHSAVLGLELVPEGNALRLYDPVEAEYLPTLLEERQSARRARALAAAEHVLAAAERERADRETVARQDAEARAARLAARLRELGETVDDV